MLIETQNGQLTVNVGDTIEITEETPGYKHVVSGVVQSAIERAGFVFDIVIGDSNDSFSMELMGHETVTILKKYVDPWSDWNSGDLAMGGGRDWNLPANIRVLNVDMVWHGCSSIPINQEGMSAVEWARLNSYQPLLKIRNGRARAYDSSGNFTEYAL